MCNIIFMLRHCMRRAYAKASHAGRPQRSCGGIASARHTHRAQCMLLFGTQCLWERRVLNI